MCAHARTHARACVCVCVCTGDDSGERAVSANILLHHPHSGMSWKHPQVFRNAVFVHSRVIVQVVKVVEKREKARGKARPQLPQQLPTVDRLCVCVCVCSDPFYLVMSFPFRFVGKHVPFHP